jgi:hypothetical protein
MAADDFVFPEGPFGPEAFLPHPANGNNRVDPAP